MRNVRRKNDFLSKFESALKQIRKYQNLFPYRVWEDIRKRGWDDFQQNLAIEIKDVNVFNYKQLFSAYKRAFLKTAEELGWKLQKNGKIVNEGNWDVLPVTKWII